MTKKTTIPTGLTQQNVGKVITVQVFRRVGEDQIDTESLEKYVGVLEGFSCNRSTLTIKIRGLSSVTVNRSSRLVEVYL